MSKVVDYKKEIEESRKKLLNNSNYLDSFGDFYIAKYLKENVDAIADEMTKIKVLIDNYESAGYVDLQPGSKT